MSQSAIYMFVVVHNIGPSLQLINNVNSMPIPRSYIRPEINGDIYIHACILGKLSI